MHSYLVKYEVSLVTTKSDIIYAQTLEEAIAAVEKDNAIRVVSIKKLGVPTKPLLRESEYDLIDEMERLYTKLDSTTDPEERMKIIAMLGLIKCKE